ncbi:hypothetical protein BDM02DRAFT_1142364 [Thelephora ganbajun]|uniref:Uncharacterized protein n=1 Tax=Thelephora ganbajun TaxID=370292 RepID=A0ACB6ZXV0_THEGA|nr:hypothetical protein BDM02DRAFT_1142364 [Thelephora ganbajun]
MDKTVKAATAAKTARKRNRRRKRRVASSSGSSSSSSEDSSSGSEDEKPTTVKLKTHAPAKPVVSEGSSFSSKSSESESESNPSSDEESTHQGDDVEMLDDSVPTENPGKERKAVYSRSPSPIPAPVPSFLPTNPDGSVDTESEQQLKDRFRKFWMQSVADAFQDDLAQIHKEPGMNKSRLAVLVDSLASGADMFTSDSLAETRGVNER